MTRSLSGASHPPDQRAAADVSPAMAEKARERLGEARNASVLVEDAQALSFSDETFDAVVCNLALMLFPEPARGLSEFRRVLRPGGWAAVSVNTVPERSYNSQINVILTRYVPGLAEAVTRVFSEELFRECGFSQIETQLGVVDLVSGKHRGTAPRVLGFLITTHKLILII